MARYVISVDQSPPKAVQQAQAKRRTFQHGPPRPFHGTGKAKGGIEVRPPFYTVGQRMPDVSLSDDATARAKRRSILNVVADAATRHNISIPGAIIFNLPNTVQANREDLLREIRRQEQRIEAQLAAEADRLELKLKAQKSKPLAVCGKCAKVITALFEGDEWRSHAAGCPERQVAWQTFMAKHPNVKRAWQLRKEIALPTTANTPKEEAELTKSDLEGTFDAAAVALAESKTDRSQYIQAGAYSDQHR